jgi:hypothetical protein
MTSPVVSGAPIEHTSGVVALSSGTDPVRLALTAAVLAFVGAAVSVILAYPVNDVFDQIQQYSLVLALRDRPTLFPAYGSYRILAPDLVHWTDEANYLAHPPLYHLAMAPLTHLPGGGVWAIRLVDVALALAGTLAATLTFLHRLPARVGPDGRVLLVVLIFGFPETAKLAGFINNDNLVVAQTGLLVWALAGAKRRPVLAGLVLAAAGWTKFNGFVGLALFCGTFHLATVFAGRGRLFDRSGLALLAGLVVGAIPALACLLTWGRPVWAPEHYPAWFTVATPEVRAATSFLAYAVWFFVELGGRFSWLPNAVDASPLLAVLAVSATIGLRSVGRGEPEIRPLAVGGLVATFGLIVATLVYGWRDFTTIGLLSAAMPRYFFSVWPFFAFVATLGVEALPKRVEPAARTGLILAVLALSPVLMPTLRSIGVFPGG